MICRGSQTVARANFISGTNIPEEKTKLLRDVISENCRMRVKMCQSEPVCITRIVRSELIM